MAIKVIELDGRKWGDNATGGSVVRRFRITGLAVGFTPAWNYDGLPKVGDKHPSLSGFVVTSRDFEEGKGKDKETVTVTVNYSPETSEASGTEPGAAVCQVDEWGWDNSTDEKELTAGVDGTPVLNSAGDPFESVPSVPVPAPVFTKVMKFKERQSGAMGYNCKVNQAAVTIGDMACPAATLLCTVAEKRLIGDPVWKYQYTVQLKFKSNPVKLGGDNAATDIGWDVAITDAGIRAKTPTGEGEKVMLIRVPDPETRTPCLVTSPALLDGNGHVRSETANDEIFNFRFQAHERASFPDWFYSEPTFTEEGLT